MKAGALDVPDTGEELDDGGLMLQEHPETINGVSCTMRHQCAEHQVSGSPAMHRWVKVCPGERKGQQMRAAA